MEEKENIVPPMGNIPIGTIVAFGLKEDYVPSDWLICDGTAIPNKYLELKKFIGPNTPNLIGKTLIGCCTKKTPNPNYPFGQVGGESKHQLTVDEMPTHNHSLNYQKDARDDDQGWPQYGFNAVYATDRNSASDSGAMVNTGRDLAHNNMQPYYAINYIIYTGHSSES